MITKKKRHETILDLVEQQSVERQEDIAAHLQQRGIQVTQATVSRDIRELGLVKQQDGRGRQRYVASNGGIDGDFSRNLAGIFSHSVLQVDCAQNIVVIRTISGAAQAAASAVDAMHAPSIVGCIAGDDTIFVVVRSNEDAMAIREKMEQMRG